MITIKAKLEALGYISNDHDVNIHNALDRLLRLEGFISYSDSASFNLFTPPDWIEAAQGPKKEVKKNAE